RRLVWRVSARPVTSSRFPSVSRWLQHWGWWDLNSFDDILKAYVRQVQLPWAADAAPAARVWIVWYDKTLQRRFTGRLGEFEHATIKAGHGWRQISIAPWLGRWIARHEFFETLITMPRELRGLLPDIENDLVRTLRQELATCTANDVLAVYGC